MQIFRLGKKHTRCQSKKRRKPKMMKKWKTTTYNRKKFTFIVSLYIHVEVNQKCKEQKINWHRLYYYILHIFYKFSSNVIWIWKECSQSIQSSPFKLNQKSNTQFKAIHVWKSHLHSKCLKPNKKNSYVIHIYNIVHTINYHEKWKTKIALW